jgi:hypothetical protein
MHGLSRDGTNLQNAIGFLESKLWLRTIGNRNREDYQQHSQRSQSQQHADLIEEEFKRVSWEAKLAHEEAEQRESTRERRNRLRSRHSVTLSSFPFRRRHRHLPVL